MVEASVRVLEDVCSRYGFRACGRLRELLGGGARLPPDLLLQALIGVAEDIEEEAKSVGLGEVAARVREARVDLEWALREAVE